jgi:hypothetical protein
MRSNRRTKVHKVADQGHIFHKENCNDMQLHLKMEHFHGKEIVSTFDHFYKGKISCFGEKSPR